MAFLRVVSERSYSEPELFFRFSWLVSAQEHNATRVEQRIADERFSPVVKAVWVGQDGQPIDAITAALLDAPYKGHGCSDHNLRSSLWHRLKDWFPDDQWQRTVIALTEQSLQHCLGLYADRKVSLYPRLLSTKAVVLCDAGFLSEAD